MASAKKEHSKNRSSSLQNNPNLYRRLIEQTPDSIFAVDLQGHITYVNRSGAKLLKDSVEHIVGKHFIRYVDKGHVPKAKEYFKEVLKGRPVRSAELNVLDAKGNSIPIEFTSSLSYQRGKPNQVHALVRDISRRKEFEMFTREADKMNALQHFISGTTQEIQRPLKGVFDRIQRLIHKYKERDFEYIGFKEFTNIMDTLEVMRDQVKYCFETMNRLLNISKRRIGLPAQEHCDMNRVVRDAVRLVHHHLEISGVSVKFKLKKKLPPAAIGNFELNEALVKILTNAIQAMAGGGHIYIRTFYQKDVKAVSVEIRDEGVGIPSENLQRVFEPFFTTKQRGLEKSSGLGLSIVYSIIKSFDGDVIIKSQARRGTRVIVMIPAYRE